MMPKNPETNESARLRGGKMRAPTSGTLSLSDATFRECSPTRDEDLVKCC